MWCNDCCEKICICTEEVKNRNDCPKCRNKMVERTVPTAPIDVADYEPAIQLRVRICPQCYFWTPCDHSGDI